MWKAGNAPLGEAPCFLFSGRKASFPKIFIKFDTKFNSSLYFWMN